MGQVEAGVPSSMVSILSLMRDIGAVKMGAHAEYCDDIIKGMDVKVDIDRKGLG